MLYFTRSDIAPNGISIDPFRELIAPLLTWGVAVFSSTAAGQPGKAQMLTIVITVGGIVICAALSTFTARATLRRYASDK